MKGVWVDVRPMMRTNDDFTRAAPQFDVANPRLKEGFTAALADGGARSPKASSDRLPRA